MAANSSNPAIEDGFIADMAAIEDGCYRGWLILRMAAIEDG